MTKHTTRSLLLAMALAATPGMLFAQGTTPAPKAPLPPSTAPATPPTKEQLEQAAYEMHVMISAMQSDKVEAAAKDAIFQCLYSNSFAKVSEAMEQVIAGNAGKVDKRNADQMLVIMAGVCGYRPQPAAAAAAGAMPGTPAPAAAKPATTTPAKPAAKTQGR